MISLSLPFMVFVAGAPYDALAKEREGAPSFFPHCSCPFQAIFPSFFVSALKWICRMVVMGIQESAFRIQNPASGIRLRLDLIESTERSDIQFILANEFLFLWFRAIAAYPLSQGGTQSRVLWIRIFTLHLGAEIAPGSQIDLSLLNTMR